MKKYSEAMRKFKRTSAHLRINVIQSYNPTDFHIKQVKDTHWELQLWSRLTALMKEKIRYKIKEELSELTFEDD